MSPTRYGGREFSHYVDEFPTIRHLRIVRLARDAPSDDDARGIAHFVHNLLGLRVEGLGARR
jgi:hypothetical protein